MSPHRQRSWAPLRWSHIHARPISSTVVLDFAHRVNQYLHVQKWLHRLGPKLFVLSLIMGDDVATHGLSIGLLLASLLQDWQHNVPSLVTNKYCIGQHTLITWSTCALHACTNVCACAWGGQNRIQISIQSPGFGIVTRWTRTPTPSASI